jgi:hypothetical protein
MILGVLKKEKGMGNVWRGKETVIAHSQPEG